MLTVKQAAERLGVSINLIYELCRCGQMAHHRYGLKRGTIRISEESLRDFQQRSRGAVRQQRVASKHSSIPSLRHIKLVRTVSR